MSWWAFPSGSFLCLLTFISQVKSLTEVHPITLIFLRSVTTLAIITPVCTPSIYETEPNNTLYSSRILTNFNFFFVGRRLVKLINLVQIGIVRDQPPFPAGQSLQGFISNQLSTFSSGCQYPILLVISSSLVPKRLPGNIPIILVPSVLATTLFSLITLEKILKTLNSDQI